MKSKKDSIPAKSVTKLPTNYVESPRLKAFADGIAGAMVESLRKKTAKKK